MFDASESTPGARAYNEPVDGRECYHCHQWIEPGQAHDCWTTTEGALTADLSEDLRDAWERIREAAVEFGDQRIYASGTAIMFSRGARATSSSARAGAISRSASSSAAPCARRRCAASSASRPPSA